MPVIALCILFGGVSGRGWYDIPSLPPDYEEVYRSGELAVYVFFVPITNFFTFQFNFGQNKELSFPLNYHKPF